MSWSGNREVRSGVIYDWKTMVEMTCGKGENGRVRLLLVGVQLCRK